MLSASVLFQKWDEVNKISSKTGMRTLEIQLVGGKIQVEMCIAKVCFKCFKSILKVLICKKLLGKNNISYLLFAFTV